MKITPRRVLRNLAVPAVKMLVVALLLVWLLGHQHGFLPPEFRFHLGPGTIHAIILALAFICVSTALSAWVLLILLRPQQFERSYVEAVGLILVGAFFGFVLPGVGNDAAKALYICRGSPERLLAAAAVLVAEYVINLLTLAALGVLLLPLALGCRLLTMAMIWSGIHQALHLVHRVPWILLPTIVLGAAAIVILWRKRLLLPRLWQHFLQALWRYRAAPHTLWLCATLILFGHLLAVACLLSGMYLLRGALPLHDISALFSAFLLFRVLQQAVQYPVHLLGGGITFFLLRVAPPGEILALLRRG